MYTCLWSAWSIVLSYPYIIHISNVHISNVHISNVHTCIQAREYCCLGHILSLWETISVELAKQLYLRGQVKLMISLLWYYVRHDYYCTSYTNLVIMSTPMLDAETVHFYDSYLGAIWLGSWWVAKAPSRDWSRCFGEMPEAVWSWLSSGCPLWIYWDTREALTRWRAGTAVSEVNKVYNNNSNNFSSSGSNLLWRGFWVQMICRAFQILMNSQVT